ncbi:hypothetical protein [Kitasatospora sp. NPDC057198]|uniref:hypothetical protein n=1 Tax=Kitasatospora sp. NPDC057198 TaxID=3346046 RepID=UPI0036320BE6
MSEHYPFEDGRNVAWVLEGFGPDDRLRSSVTLTREQYLRVRALFDLDDGDEWMMAGAYPVPAEARGPLQAVVGEALFDADVDYFLGAHQDLPTGLWPPAGVSGPFPGPIPQP